MSPFDPLGERARWRVLYDLLREVPTDGILTYEVMGGALELDRDDDRHTIQMAMRRAAKEHERADKRAAEAVPNVGYRVVQVQEHLRLARDQQKRAGKALVRGHSKVVNVDFNDLEPAVRKSFEVVAHAFSMQMDFNRRFDVRQKRLEEAVAAFDERSKRTADEVAELQERLARLEKPES